MTNKEALRQLENQPFNETKDFEAYMRELFRLWDLQASGSIYEKYERPEEP